MIDGAFIHFVKDSDVWKIALFEYVLEVLLSGQRIVRLQDNSFTYKNESHV